MNPSPLTIDGAGRTSIRRLHWENQRISGMSDRGVARRTEPQRCTLQRTQSLPTSDREKQSCQSSRSRSGTSTLSIRKILSPRYRRSKKSRRYVRNKTNAKSDVCRYPASRQTWAFPRRDVYDRYRLPSFIVSAKGEIEEPVGLAFLEDIDSCTDDSSPSLESL